METRRDLTETRRSEDVMLSYLEEISKRLDHVEGKLGNVEANSSLHEEACKKLLVEHTGGIEKSLKALCIEQQKQSKYFFAGRIIFATFTFIALCFWGLVENSHTLSDLYFNFIDGAKNDHTGHSK